jgi:hypothetical protein
MKLIFCGECHDIVKLTNEIRWCECKSVWGYYTDDINATISNGAIPLGFANSTFVKAFTNRNKFQDLSFKAFFINDDCPTIDREIMTIKDNRITEMRITKDELNG